MQEQAVLIGHNREVFGIYHEPNADTPDKLAIIFLNSGLIHRPGPFRLYTDLARELGKRGIHSLRIDQCGKGDSPRRPGMNAMDSAQLDFEAASGFFKSKGIDKLIVAGLCSGADDAFWLAKNDSSIFGIVMFDGYAPQNAKYRKVALVRKLKRFTLNKLLSKLTQRFNRKKTSNNEGSLADLRNFPSDNEGVSIFRQYIAQKQKGLFFYTGDIGHYYNHFGQLKDSVGDPRFSDFITEVHFPQAKHTYPFVSDRIKLIQTVCEWAENHLESSDGTQAARIANASNSPQHCNFK